MRTEHARRCSEMEAESASLEQQVAARTSDLEKAEADIEQRWRQLQTRRDEVKPFDILC